MKLLSTAAASLGVFAGAFGSSKRPQKRRTAEVTADASNDDQRRWGHFERPHQFALLDTARCALQFYANRELTLKQMTREVAFPGCLLSYDALLAQSLPSLSADLNTNGKGHVCGCIHPSQPWPGFTTYLNAYVLVFLAKEGWFFAASTDLADWSSPTQFFTALNPEFVPGLPADENMILVTLGNPIRMIGQTGMVLYAHTPAWDNASHELWSRPFTFQKKP